MANNPKFLKKLLTTASAVAIATGAASSAYAVARTTAAGANVVVQGVGANGPNVTVAANDWIQIANAGDAVAVNAANVVIAGFDTAFNPGALTFAGAYKLSTGSITGVAVNALNVTMLAGSELELTASTYAPVAARTFDKLGNINFNNTNGKVTINAPGGDVTLAGNFTNAANGTLDIRTNFISTAAGNNSAGVVGNVSIGTALAAADFVIQPNAGGGAATFKSNVNFVHADSRIIFDSTNAGAPSVFTLTGSTIAPAVNSVGGRVKTFANGQDVTIAKAAAESLGISNTQRLKELEIAGAGTHDTTINVNTFAQKILFNDVGRVATFGAVVDSGAGGEGKFLQAQTVQFNDNATIATIDYNNLAGVVKIADGKTLTGNLVGDAANAGNVAGILTFDGDATFAGVATKLTKINAGVNLKTAKFSGEHTVTEVRGTGTGTLQFADGFKLNGAINSAVGNAVVLKFMGNGVVTGTIGAGAPTGNILVSGGAGKVVELQGNTTAAAVVFDTADGAAVKFGGNYTGNVTFTNDGEIQFTAGVHTLTGNITGANKGKITGTTVGANRLTLTGDLGATGAANYLKLIEMKQGILNFGGNAFVQNIDITGNNTTIEFESAANNTYVFNLVHSQGQGVLEIKEDSIFGDASGAVNIVGADAANPVAIDRINFNKAGAVKLTVAKGMNISAVNGITTSNANQGQLEFTQGTSIIDAQIGLNTAKLDTLELGAVADVKVTLKKDAYFNGAVTFSDATNVLTFSGANFVATDFVSNVGAGKGSLALIANKTTDMTIDSKVGNAAAIKGIAITGAGNIEIKGAAVNAQSIDFNTAEGGVVLNLSGVAANALALQKVTSQGNFTDTVKVKTNQTFVGGTQFGADATHIVNLLVDNATERTINVNTNAFFGRVLTTENNKGFVELNAPGATVYGVGSNAASVNELRLKAADTVVGGSAFAEDTFIDNDLKTTFKAGGEAIKEIAGLKFNAGYKGKLQVGQNANSNNAQATFEDNAAAFGDALNNSANKGKLIFAGNTYINGKLGSAAAKFEALTFSGDNTKTIYLDNGSELHSNTTTVGAAKVNLLGNSTLNGNTTFTGSEFSLNSSSLNVLGGKTTLAGAIKVNTSYDGATIGNMRVAQGAEIDASTNLTSLQFNINDKRDTATIAAAIGKDLIVSIIDAGQGTLKIDGANNRPTVISNQNDLIRWDYLGNGRAGVVYQGQQVITAQVAAAGRDAIAIQQASELTDARNTGSALQVLGDFTGMTAAQRVESVDRQGNVNNAGGLAAAEETVDLMNQTITSRTTTVTEKPVNRSAQGEGVAAGSNDGPASYGAWGSAFFGQGIQKSKSGTSGFRVRNAGGVVGFDTMANDTMTVGVAAAMARGDVKYKSFKSGDKTKVDSFMFSIYGLQQLTENWFLQGFASFGSGKVKNTEKLLGSKGYVNATGKYDVMSYSGELLAGYGYNFSDNLVATPMVGLGYSKFNESGYTETGAGFRNRTVSKKSTDRFELIGGLRVHGGTEMNDMMITPEVHAFVKQNLSNKAVKADVKLDGLASGNLTQRSYKPGATDVNLGVGLTIKSGMLDYGATYDAHLANKYVGHQGTLKVRVNF